MVKYNFRLQRVLDIRDVELEKAQHELYQVRQKEKEIEQKLADSEEKLESLFDYIRQNNLSVTENIRTREYIKKQQERVREVKKELKNHREIVKQYKDNLIEKKQAKEKIKKIKEKKSTAFYKELLRKEQKEIDEVSLRKSQQGV